MALSIAARERDDVTILEFRGRITLGEGSVLMRETVHDLLAEGKKNILLNLDEVTYIDASGLGELVSAFTTSANAGAKFKLLNVYGDIATKLQQTKLYTVFDTYTDEDHAVASFRNNRPQPQLVPNGNEAPPRP